MTGQQATEVREHLIKELNTHGFGDIVSEINIRLQESYEEGNFQRNPRYLLDFFLRESIEILNGLSNKDFQNLISRFNEFTIGNNDVESISVELLNQGEQVLFDLSELPNYNEIIDVFTEVLEEIRKEN